MITVNNETRRTLLWLTLFSIAMGYLETAVVVYLRKLYYPAGFAFPLTPVPPDVAIAEFWREFATMIMLIGAGILAGRNKAQRLVFFLFCFGVWDIFYYVFLYVLLGWPQSLFTWDILFLIPVPWVGPVLCPCIVSLTMIALMLLTLFWQHKGRSAHLVLRERMVLIIGCLVIIFSFMWDYFRYVNEHGKSAWSLSGTKKLFSEGKGYIPHDFNWLLFFAGELVLLTALFLFHRRMKKDARTPDS